jgi:[protein-PII] uridylyltransferase
MLEPRPISTAGSGRPRAVLDRRRLRRRLAGLVAGRGRNAEPLAAGARAAALDVFRRALAAGFAEVRRRFEEEALPGAAVVGQQAALVDQLVRAVHDFARAAVHPAADADAEAPLALVALGGYGRAQLAPYSDVDLMFLHAGSPSPRGERVIEYVLYTLWDAGLKVGHATRSIEEAMRLALGDVSVRTSFLEARWLWGDRALYREFRKRFLAEVVRDTGSEFTAAKLDERDRRHKRFGDTRYLLEPNVKEGKGGLRDLNTLFWIAKYLYRVEAIQDLVAKGVLTPADARTFAKAENFLLTVRCHLHYLAGRAEERLTFDTQREIGRRMGYTDRAGTRGVERFMKHYYLTAKDVGDLTRILCAVIEDQHRAGTQPRPPQLALGGDAVAGFRVEGGRLSVAGARDFKSDPVNLIRLFHTAHERGLDIHPRALRLVTQNLDLVDGRLRANAEANRLFLELLTSRKNPEWILMSLNEAGVFGRFVTDFGRVVAQMQYDMYHVYTVDEHLIRAIGILSRIERGELARDHPVSTEVMGEVQSRRALYLAVLLHDIAKGRGGDHSDIGAEIAEKLGPRLGFNAWETETTAWLVRHHLLMSRTAFKRDIDDPQTIADFVRVVQSPERLRMLLVLTVADIRAVGPNVWNAWKANLLRELYFRARDAISGVPSERRDRRAEAAKERLRAALADWGAADVEAHLEKGRADYWLAFDVATHVRHARLVRAAEAEGRDPVVETRVEEARGVTEVVVLSGDRPGLFAALAGAIALAGASIVDARIVTLANGMALDTFWVQDVRGHTFDGARRLDALVRRIEEALQGRIDPARELEHRRRTALPSRTQVFTVPPRVIIDNKASQQHTVVEINGRDRLGFLHDVTAALTGLGLQIASAHVTTYGERAVDVFYVKDAFGLKVEHAEKLKAIHDRILDAVAGQARAQPAAADAAVRAREVGASREKRGEKRGHNRKKGTQY